MVARFKMFTGQCFVIISKSAKIRNRYNQVPHLTVLSASKCGCMEPEKKIGCAGDSFMLLCYFLTTPIYQYADDLALVK